MSIPYQIDTPVLVDVRQPVPFVTALPVFAGDGMAPKLAGSVVLVPVEGVVDAGSLGPAIGTGEIQVAVAVQVGRGHGVGVGVIVGDEVFLELQVPGLKQQARSDEAETDSVRVSILGPIHDASRLSRDHSLPALPVSRTRRRRFRSPRMPLD